MKLSTLQARYLCLIINEDKAAQGEAREDHVFYGKKIAKYIKALASELEKLTNQASVVTTGDNPTAQFKANELRMLRHVTDELETALLAYALITGET